jgi:abortive infection bacteriophage resistance protein
VGTAVCKKYMERTMITDKIEKDKLKKPTTFEEQLNILKDRNLQIEDEQQALDILSRINYYRLR